MESKNQLGNIFKLDKIIGSHAAPIYCIETYSDNKHVFSGSGDKMLGKWNYLIGLQDKFSIQLDSSAYQILHIEESNLLIVGLSNGNIHVIDLSDKKEIKLLKLSDAAVYTLQYSQKHQMLLATTGDSKVGIWKLDNFEIYQAFQFESGKIRDLLIKDNLFIIACQTGEIRGINFLELKEEFRFQAHDSSVYSLHFLDHKNLLVSGGQDAHLRFWKLENKEEVLSIPAHNFSIYDIAENDDYLFTASRDASIKIWDKNSLDLVQKLDYKSSQGHTKSVNTIKWDKKSQSLFSAGDDSKLMMWRSMNK